MKNLRLNNLFESMVAVFSVLMLGFIDCATGYYLSFFVFYFIPIAVIASRHGARAAYTVCLLSAATWYTSAWLTGHPYPSAWMGIWNAATRLAAFVVVAHTVGRIHDLLRSAQNEVATLRAFIPICAKCKKIRDDKGYWQKLESYFSQHTDMKFSHGLCQECASKMLSEWEDTKTPEQGGGQ